jgi:cellulose synthase/poly-beta-1,6-N-acetylglucosamine synthase-like glycosyltransferase
MTAPELVFWLAAGLVAYTYLVYPLRMALLARLCGRPVRRAAPFTGGVSIVLAVYNEEPFIGRRLEELTGQLAAAGRPGEILVVSDGSTDGTAVVAKAHGKAPVRVLELPHNGGKAAALTEGCAAARHEVVVFADARQSWAPDALGKLLRNFADPEVGAVSGDLVVESSSGVMAGVGLYWRHEKWLRQQESRVHSVVGVTGAISAVRRHLFRPVPARTVLDDVYWPLRVTMQGFRVVHDSEARAYDRLPETARDEFRRKMRTLSGNFQLLSRLPTALLPWRNPIWFEFLSHKVLRLLVPWALLLLLGLCAVLPGPLYWWLLVGQLAGYGFGLGGVYTAGGKPTRLAGVAASFVVLNAAAWMAFWLWVTGKAARTWCKVVYRAGAPAQCPGQTR